MKKLLIATVFILLAGLAFGQNLQKGGSFGLHVMTLHLDPDVTLNQYLDFLVNKYIPEAEKHFKGVTFTAMDGVRGKHENKIAMVLYFESEEARDRYWPEEGKGSDETKEAMKKLKPVYDELRKLGTWTDEYSGWVVL